MFSIWLLKYLSDVIQLKVKIKMNDKEDETREYSYSDLKELQSKLTLVAGDKQRENKDTIQRFDAVSYL